MEIFCQGLLTAFSACSVFRLSVPKAINQPDVRCIGASRKSWSSPVCQSISSRVPSGAAAQLQIPLASVAGNSRTIPYWEMFQASGSSSQEDGTDLHLPHIEIGKLINVLVRPRGCLLLYTSPTRTSIAHSLRYRSEVIDHPSHDPMSSPNHITQTTHPTCYFSIPQSSSPRRTNDQELITPPLSSASDKSPVTPTFKITQPATPPVSPYSPRKMDMSKLLQLQTQASHNHKSTRPQPQPLQNVLHVDVDLNDESASSDSSYSSSTSQSCFDTARCSRCQRTPSIDVRTGQNNMIEYGLNLFYCTRCANIVGFGNR